MNRILLAIQILLKGGGEMMAMFFAQRVILEKITFDKVPSSLKDAVKAVLVESGLEFLINE